MRQFFAAGVIALFGFLNGAQAQVPPSESEIGQYRGLFDAAHRGDLPALQILLKNGEKPDPRDASGRTPFLVATFAGHHAIMESLVKAGADPRAKEFQNYDAITIAAVKDDPDTMSLAIKLGGSAKEITSPYIGTALIAAAHLGHDEVVRRLIKAGAPLDHVNNLGWTAMIEVVILGRGGPRHIASLRALIDAGARRDLADRQGRTPLDHARERGYAAMVAMLEKTKP